MGLLNAERDVLDLVLLPEGPELAQDPVNIPDSGRSSDSDSLW